MYLHQTATPNFHINLRALGSIALGVIMTFGLFVLMAKLVEQDKVYVAPEPIDTIGPITLQLEEETTVERPKLKPIEPPTTLPPSPPMIEESTPNETFSTVEVPSIGIGTEFIIDTSMGNGMTDQQASPAFRVDPTYPTDAARDGIEGWVKLSYTVAANGSVTDIQVLDAQPKRIFDRAARRALGKWKYKPKMEDGKPISQGNMQVVLEFKLDQ